MSSYQKIDQFSITGTIVLLSGTRIGGSDDQLKIGGVDLTCIKNPVTGQPYIPGTSLKGKMRSEMERMLDLCGSNGDPYRSGDTYPYQCTPSQYLVAVVFGPHMSAKHQFGPSRLIVRDASLISGGDIEIKSENIINRNNNTAQHPRQLERVCPGAQFALAMEIQVFQMDHDYGQDDYPNKGDKARCVYAIEPGDTPARGADALKLFVADAIDQLIATGIGSGTGKGYGRIRIDNLQCVRRPRKGPTATLLTSAPAEANP